MKLLSIVKSPLKSKKLRANFSDGTHTDFGAAGMSDYTIHKDPERRMAYMKRHAKDLDTKDPRRAGFLSFYILWGPHTTIDANIAEYKKRFNM